MATLIASLVAQSLILRCFGYTVLEASNPDEAWCVCGQHSGMIHLIVTEAILDNDSSREFVTWLQVLYPEVRALLLTDASSEQLAEKFSMPCECAFLQRPFRVNALADVIGVLLHSPRMRAGSSRS